MVQTRMIVELSSARRASLLDHARAARSRPIRIWQLLPSVADGLGSPISASPFVGCTIGVKRKEARRLLGQISLWGRVVLCVRILAYDLGRAGLTPLRLFSIQTQNARVRLTVRLSGSIERSFPDILVVAVELPTFKLSTADNDALALSATLAALAPRTSLPLAA